MGQSANKTAICAAAATLGFFVAGAAQASFNTDASQTGLSRYQLSAVNLAPRRDGPPLAGRELAVDPVTTGGVTKRDAKSRVKRKKRKNRAGVFGSVAIPFGNIATRKSWDRSTRNLVLNAASDCNGNSRCKVRQKRVDDAVTLAKDDKFFGKLERINAAVNQTIRYRSDKETYRSFDYWASPSQTIRRGFGDCEDYAILKMGLLKKVGVPESSMSLVVLKDVDRNLYHAVLAVFTTKGVFILDNNLQTVVLDRQLPNYLPLYSFGKKRSWIHAWKRSEKKKLAATQSLDLSKIQPGESIAVEPVSKKTDVAGDELALATPVTADQTPDDETTFQLRATHSPI